jgi:hypothetical protein
MTYWITRACGWTAAASVPKNQLARNVPCYQRNRREQVRAVMRYAGPRMLWEHPVLTVRHWLDGMRKAPALTR